MVKSLFVIIGEDVFSKRIFVDKLKSKIPPQTKIYYKVFFAQDLAPSIFLEDILIMKDLKFIVIHCAQLLSGECKEVIQKYWHKFENCILVLDCDRLEDDEIQEPFWKFIFKKARVQKIGLKTPVKLENLWKALDKENLSFALDILNTLASYQYSSKNSLLRVLAGVINYAHTTKRIDPFSIFEIERKVKLGEDPKLMLELLIVKMCASEKR